MNYKERIALFLDTLLAPLHYPLAVRRLAELERRGGDDISRLFDVPFAFRGPGLFNIISPSQVKDEVRFLFDAVRGLDPKCVVEIGTDKGGTLYLWCKAARKDALVVSLDLPNRLHYLPWRRKFYCAFAKKGQDLRFLPGDSHAGRTFDLLKRMLGGVPIDFLFIDGDHTYEGVKQDFLMYFPLVRESGLIAFHDIQTLRDGVGVPRFWKEIKGTFPGAREFCFGTPGPLGGGIGLMTKTSKGKA